METFQLPDIGDIEQWILTQISSSHPSTLPPNGLAVLVGCKTSFNRNHKRLGGVEQDLKSLKDAFSQLLFTTLPLFDPTADHVKKVIKTVCNLQKCGIRQPNSWKRVIVTFSGHGDKTHLYTKDAKIKLHSDIMDPLIDCKENLMVGIAKLFFIDACRGCSQDYGIDLSDLHYRGEQTFVPRGERVPTKGNYLVAYSTLLGMEALESAERGGCWMQLLSKMLLHPSMVEKSVTEVLMEVNGKLLKWLNATDIALQQPELTSTINEPILLQKEALRIKESAQQYQYSQLHQVLQFPAQPFTATNITTPAEHGELQFGISYMSSSGNLAPSTSMGSVGFPELSMFQQTSGPPSALLPTSWGSFGTGDMLESHRNTSPLGASLMHHTVPASSSCTFTTRPSASPHGAMPASSLNMCTTRPSTLSTADQHCQHVHGIFEACPLAPVASVATVPRQHSTLSQASPIAHCSPGYHLSDRGLTGNNDVGHYRSLLNTYIQKKSLRKPVWNDEPCEGGGYCATVEIEITKGTVVEGRCRKKQLTKREAQEKAAKSLLDQIEGSCAQALGQPSSSSPPKTSSSTKKQPKSVLKEFCDSKWKGQKTPDYRNRETNKGFISKLLCPDVGYVESDPKPTKKEAENNAAKKALDILMKQ